MIYIVVVLGFIGLAYLTVESNELVTQNQKKIYDKLKDIEDLMSN